jgi:NADPH:quinone reductase-like Zn-dependent oxidoreductase
MSPFKAYLIEETEGRAESGFTTLEVAHHGAYGEIAWVPRNWVVPLPEGLSLFEAMALGAAGYSAALGIARASADGA